MKKIKIYSLLASVCLCIIYLSSIFISTKLNSVPITSYSENISITDASARMHLEGIISDGLFTVPSPSVESLNNPTIPSIVRANLDEKNLISDKVPVSLTIQGNTVGSRSQNISIQFEHSSHYYVFALHHIII